MKMFQAKLRRWGRSYGIVIPAEIIESEKISTKVPATFVYMPPSDGIWATFGTFKTKKSTAQLLKEARRGEPRA